MHTPRVSRDRSSMLLGGALVGAGVVIGTWIASVIGGPPAFAAGGPESSSTLPAITLGRQDMVPLRDQGGVYFLLDASGTTMPVRMSDNDMKNIPGKTILRAP